MEKHKKPRESTDLAEYIFLGTNNFSQLQIVKKLELCKVGWISENLRKSQALMRLSGLSIREEATGEKLNENLKRQGRK